MDSTEQAQLLLRRNYTTMNSLTGKVPSFLDIRYVVDGKPQDKFWQRVKRGVKYVANLYGVSAAIVATTNDSWYCVAYFAL